MDDESTRLLRELRDIVARAEARDSEWIAELRANMQSDKERVAGLQERADRYNAKMMRFVQIAIGSLIVVVGWAIFEHLR